MPRPGTNALALVFSQVPALGRGAASDVGGVPGGCKGGEVVEAKLEARPCDCEEFEENHSQAMHLDGGPWIHGGVAYM